MRPDMYHLWFAHALVVFLDVGVGPVVGAEQRDVGLRILVAHRRVGVEAQHLVGADRPGDFLVDIGLDQLRAPVAVIAADEADDGDVVQQAGQHHLLRQAGLHRMPRALQQMHGGPEAQLEEVDQGRLRRHRRQARVVAHQHARVGVGLQQRGGARRRAEVASARLWRRDLTTMIVELARHLLFQRVGALGKSCGRVHKVCPPRCRARA